MARRKIGIDERLTGYIGASREERAAEMLARTPMRPATLVAAICSTAAGQSMANGGFTVVDFGTKHLDTHGVVTGTGSNWKFTVPAGYGGLYLVNAGLSISSFPAGLTDFLLEIWLNGGGVRRGNRFNNTTGGLSTVTVSASLSLVPGDFIQIAGYQFSGANRTLDPYGHLNYFDVHRVPSRL